MPDWAALALTITADLVLAGWLVLRIPGHFRDWMEL